MILPSTRPVGKRGKIAWADNATMQSIQPQALEAALRAEHEARNAPVALNRHERRAVAVMERREAMKRAVDQRVAPTFYGTGVSLDIIAG